MTYTSNSPRFGPAETPSVIKKLLLATGVGGVAIAMLHALVSHGWGLYSPQHLFSLSWIGMSNFMVWEPFTYLFVADTAGGISVSFFLYLIFNLYIMWVIGSLLVEQIGATRFLRFYLGTGIACGLVAFGMMAFLGDPRPLAGCTAVVFSMLILWSMYFPETEILLFLTLPVKTKWLITGLISITLLVHLAQGDFTRFAWFFAALVAGYGYGTVRCQLNSPFAFTGGLDSRLQRMGQRRVVKKQRREDQDQDIYSSAKIFDFRTGEAKLDDEEFVDAMLNKISSYGEESLSRKERKRMEAISQRKRQESGSTGSE